MRNLVILLTCLALLSEASQGQNLGVDHQWIVNPYGISPANSGHNPNFEVFGTFRKNWVGVDKSPERIKVNANGQFFKNMGIGVDLAVDKAGVYRSISAVVSYAYHLQLSPSQKLSAGLRLGVYENRLDFSDLSQQGLSDPYLLGDQNANKLHFNTGFGLVYRYKTLAVGFTIPEILNNKVKGEKDATVYTSSRKYIIHTDYLYEISNDWHLRSHFIFDIVGGGSFSYTIAIQAGYLKKVWLNVLYRSGNQVMIGIGGAVHRRIVLNYGYEIPLGGIANESSGTHEVTLGFLIGKKKNNKSSIFGRNNNAPYQQYVE